MSGGWFEITFIWRGLLVTCQACRGTTAGSGPDPDCAEDFSVTFADGTPLPDELEEFVLEHGETELNERAAQELR